MSAQAARRQRHVAQAKMAGQLARTGWGQPQLPQPYTQPTSNPSSFKPSQPLRDLIREALVKQIDHLNDEVDRVDELIRLADDGMAQADQKPGPGDQQIPGATIEALEAGANPSQAANGFSGGVWPWAGTSYGQGQLQMMPGGAMGFDSEPMAEYNMLVGRIEALLRMSSELKAEVGDDRLERILGPGKRGDKKIGNKQKQKQIMPAMPALPPASPMQSMPGPPGLGSVGPQYPPGYGGGL